MLVTSALFFVYTHFMFSEDMPYASHLVWSSALSIHLCFLVLSPVASGRNALV